MHTTISIDDDLLDILREQARKENISLSGLVNRLLRAGLDAARREPGGQRGYREETYAMGSPTADLDKALSLAAGLEEQETVGKP